MLVYLILNFSLGKPEIVALSDDDSDSLDLSEPENNCPKVKLSVYGFRLTLVHFFSFTFINVHRMC